VRHSRGQREGEKGGGRGKLGASRSRKQSREGREWERKKGENREGGKERANGIVDANVRGEGIKKKKRIRYGSWKNRGEIRRES